MSRVVSSIRRVALWGGLLSLAVSSWGQVIPTTTTTTPTTTVTPTTVSTPSTTTTTTTTTAVLEPTAAESRFEQNFLIAMIDHHYAGVQLADLVSARASHDDLKSLAASIRISETLEIERLQGWLQTWYGVTYEPEVSRSLQRDLDELTSLSGDDFDKTFLVALGLHDAEALAQASDAVLHAFHADVIDTARLTLSAKADEIALVRVWLNQWYGITEVSWSALDGVTTTPTAKTDPTETPMTPIPTTPTTGTTNNAATATTSSGASNAATNVTTPTATSN